jgi:hypothetical protein
MSIDAIHTSPEGSGSMISSESVNVIAGVGIENDRYAKAVGSYSCLKASTLQPGQREPGRQVTMISADDLDAAVQRGGIPLSDYGGLRRNIVVRGMAQKPLIGVIGSAVQLGETVIIFCHRHCVPCMYNERKNAIPGLLEAIWDEAGVSCEVLVGGTIEVGDEVKVLSKEELADKYEGGSVQVDVGHQPPGFFVKPSKRSADMVKGGLSGKKELHAILLADDPVGVDRLEKSYNSVGLTFWPKSK